MSQFELQEAINRSYFDIYEVASEILPLRMTSTSSKGETWVDINDFLSFVFPKHIQHPLTSGRLFCYALFGPVDADNNLRSGFKRSHVLHDYELENMCIQFDREDVISIFVSDFEELSNDEQSMIVGQADSKFKIARGKAMLQTLSRAEILHLIKVIQSFSLHQNDANQVRLILVILHLHQS